MKGLLNPCTIIGQPNMQSHKQKIMLGDMATIDFSIFQPFVTLDSHPITNQNLDWENFANLCHFIDITWVTQ